MKEKIKTYTEKTLEFPTKIYTKKDLDRMQVAFVENQIFLNKVKPKEEFPAVSEDIAKNMIVINYVDCSAEFFSEETLKDIVKRQVTASGDFIALPYFKGESDYDIRLKGQIAENLKLNIEKEIIFEISYKATISETELSNIASNFDYLSVFYGTSYGHYPSFEKIAMRIASFKSMTGKKTFCLAVPLKFSGAYIEDVRFMPCFSIVSDGWVKNWRRGGGKGETKVVDLKDFKAKTYQEWLASGYQPNSMLAPINRTVYELFQDDSKSIREEYEAYIMDEVMTEIKSLTPTNVMDYVGKKFHNKYFQLIIATYREKVINSLRSMKELEVYSRDNRMMIERKIREIFAPQDIERAISNMKMLIEREQAVPLQRLIEVIDRSRTS